MSFYDALGKCTWCFNLELEADILYCFSPDACESILRSLMVSTSNPRLELGTCSTNIASSRDCCMVVRAFRTLGCGDGGMMDYSLYYASFHLLPSKYACMGSAQFSLHFQKFFWEMVLFPQLFAFCSCSCFMLRCGVPLPSGTSISTSCCRMLGFSIPLNLAFYVDFRG